MIHVSLLSAHILFDDAMTLTDDDEVVPNDFVTQLVTVVDDAGRYAG